MSMHNPKHPIWNLAKAVLFFGFVVLFSYTNASEFDSTEVTMLMQLAAVLFSGVAVETLLSQHRKS